MKKNFSPPILFLNSFQLILLIACLGLLQSTAGQNRPTRLEMSYLGNNLWNPGVKLALDTELSQQKLQSPQGKEKSLHKSHRLDAGFYVDPGSYTGLFINAGWQRKTIYPKRYFISWAANPVGLFRSFLPETYQVSPNGEIDKVALPGRLYLAPSFQAGVGRISGRHPNRSYFARLNMIILLPYNTFIMPLLNIELGCTISK